MAVSELSLAQRTLAALVSAGADPTKIKIPNLIALIPDAVELMAKRIAAGPDYEGLQKSFAATITSGAIDLTAVARILFDPLRALVFPPSSTTPAVFLEMYEDMVHGNLPTGGGEAIYYAQDGAKLRFRNTDGSLTSLSGAATISANYLPDVADANFPIPTQYEGALVQTMIELATRSKQDAAEITEVGGRA